MLFARSLRPIATPLRFQLRHVSNRMSAANSAPTVPTTAPAKWPSPEDWPASKVRKTYIDFFTGQPGFEHTFWPSSGVIPFDDDTLLFANAVSRQHLPLKPQC